MATWNFYELSKTLQFVIGEYLKIGVLASFSTAGQKCIYSFVQLYKNMNNQKYTFYEWIFKSSDYYENCGNLTFLVRMLDKNGFRANYNLCFKSSEHLIGVNW